jgi:hypothetical protein
MRSTVTRGRAEPVQVRIYPDLWKAVEDWRRAQANIPTRPEAIRLLVKRALDESRRQASLVEAA